SAQSKLEDHSVGMSRWFKSAAKAHHPAMTADEEDAHLQSVETALLKLLDDDIGAADKILTEQNSSYHLLGRGISSFIASMLGVEKELLKEAATALQIAESRTWEDMKKAQKEPSAFRSEIYPPGTEYLLCYAIAQLTSAITAVMSGSVTQAISGFYKLRKAYLTLDGIMEVESQYFKKRASSRRTSAVSRRDTINRMKTQDSSNTQKMSGDAANPSIEAIMEKVPTLNEQAPDPNLIRTSTEVENALGPTISIPPILPTRTKSNLLDQDPESLGITSHTDIFIHSGTRLCYGILLVVFSMIENPIFNRILYIVGFKGDRERGTRYLWQASRFDNFNSAIAGISLLGYYNGLIGFCDILPTDPDAANDLSGYPKARCEALLECMIAKYPTSKLWRLEEARMLAYNHNLPAAVKILNDNSDGNMKQIAAINMFERSLSTMFVHDYESCAKSWIVCAEASSWSPCLYAYMTGASYLELYRNCRNSDLAKAKEWKKKATDYIRKGPPLAGRQKVMSKPLPFDVYITRKVRKWEERAKAWKVDLVDAIGTSPLAEMMCKFGNSTSDGNMANGIDLWNGIKKMAPEQLQKTMGILGWERTTHPEKHKADLDDTAICALLRASLLRNSGKCEEARSVLNTEILAHDRAAFKGHLKDDWALPSANYEMAALSWNEKDLEGVDSQAKVLDCEQWLMKTQKWGDAYVLDTRMSFKITTSLITVKRHKKIMGY
ncbi:Inclusion body clearance iml2, partial [Hyphodiscus hymeniophilus]